jgi:hypothetical protein
MPLLEPRRGRLNYLIATERLKICISQDMCRCNRHDGNSKTRDRLSIFECSRRTENTNFASVWPHKIVFQSCVHEAAGERHSLTIGRPTIPAILGLNHPGSLFLNLDSEARHQSAARCRVTCSGKPCLAACFCGIVSQARCSIDMRVSAPTPSNRTSTSVD